MELAAYIIVVGIACALAVRSHPLSPRTFAAICYGIFLALSIIVRISGFDSDIEIYAERMSYAGNSAYYLREPIVWYGHRLFWTVTRSPVASLIFSDMVLFSVMFFAFKRLKLPQYAYISILAFFPFIMGMQNIYRQFSSSILFIAAMAAVIEQKNGRSIVFFLLSVLSHNVSVIFLPLLLIFGRYRRVTFAVGLILIPVAIYIGGGTKSGAETGASLEWVYVAFLTVLCSFLFVSEGGHRNIESPISLMLIISVHANVASAIILESAIAERVSLFTLLAVYPILIMTIEKRFSEKFLLRSALSVVGFMPILIAGTRTFILEV